MFRAPIKLSAQPHLYIVQQVEFGEI